MVSTTAAWRSWPTFTDSHLFDPTQCAGISDKTVLKNAFSYQIKGKDTKQLVFLLPFPLRVPTHLFCFFSLLAPTLRHVIH
jgi:hypothetical protein